MLSTVEIISGDSTDPMLRFTWNSDGKSDPTDIHVRNILGGLYRGESHISVDNFVIKLDEDSLKKSLKWEELYQYFEFLGGTGLTSDSGEISRMSSDIRTLFSLGVNDLKFYGHINDASYLSTTTLSGYFNKNFGDKTQLSNGSFIPVEFDIPNLVVSTTDDKPLTVGDGDIVIIHNHTGDMTVPVSSLVVGENVFVLKAGVSRYEFERDVSDKNAISGFLDKYFKQFPSTTSEQLLPKTGILTDRGISANTVSAQNAEFSFAGITSGFVCDLVTHKSSSESAVITNLCANNLTCDTSLSDKTKLSIITHVKQDCGVVSISAKELTEGCVSNLCADIKNLCCGISSKVYIDNSAEGVSGYTELSVVKLTKEAYENLVANNACNPKTIYVVSSDYIDAYGQKIQNLKDATDDADAVNLKQLSNTVSDTSDTLTGIINSTSATLTTKLTGTVSSVSSFLDEKIDSRIEIEDSVSGLINGNSNLKVVKLKSSEYESIVLSAQPSAIASTLYVVEYDNVNAYGAKVVHVGDAKLSDDAVNLGQVSGISADIHNELTTVSDSLQKKILNKVFVHDKVNNASAFTDISVVRISRNDYADVLKNTKLSNSLSNTLYIVEDDALDAYGQKVVNVQDGTDLSDAMNVRQIQEISNGITSDVKTKYDELNTAIGNKIWIGNILSDESGYVSSAWQQNLSVMKVSGEKYDEMVVNGEVNKLSNVLFDIDYEFVNAYDTQVKNVATPSDACDAVNLSTLNAVSTSIDAKMVKVLGDTPTVSTLTALNGATLGQMAMMVEFIFTKLGGDVSAFMNQTNRS